MSALEDKLSQWRRETDVDPSPALMAELAALAEAPPAPSLSGARWSLAKTALVAVAVAVAGLVGWLISPAHTEPAPVDGGVLSEAAMKTPQPVLVELVPAADGSFGVPVAAPVMAAPVPAAATPRPPGQPGVPARARGELAPADTTPRPPGKPGVPARARGELAPADATPLLPTGKTGAPARARGELVPADATGAVRTAPPRQLMELVSEPRRDGGPRP